MLKIGDKLPAGSLHEFVEVEGEGCSVGPNKFEVEKLTLGSSRPSRWGCIRGQFFSMICPPRP